MRPIRSSIVSAAVCAALAASAVFAQENQPPPGQDGARPNAAQQENQQPGQPGQARQQPGQARQQPGQPGQPAEREANFPPREQAGGSSQAGQVNDQLLAKWLIADNQGEIALAEFAQERAESEQVKEFAKKMIQDHQQFVQKLQRTAGQQGNQLGQAGAAAGESQAQRQPARPGQPQPRPAQPGQDQPSAQAETAQAESAQQQEQRTTGFRPGQSSGGKASDVAELKQQLGQKHTASLREELGRYEGADFDKAFMHTAAMAHVKMADTLEVFQQNASPQLRETLAQGLQTTKQHLQMAKQIRQELEQQGSGGQQRPQSQQQQRRQQQQRQQQQSNP